MPKGLLSDPADNVATVLSEVQTGEDVLFGGCNARSVQALNPIPLFHKIAVTDIPEGGVIMKYGNPMGIATMAIIRGEHVHVHNVASGRARRGMK
jgi:altronate dehydratase